jgi:hypothetical protein
LSLAIRLTSGALSRFPVMTIDAIERTEGSKAPPLAAIRD